MGVALQKGGRWAVVLVSIVAMGALLGSSVMADGLRVGVGAGPLLTTAAPSGSASSAGDSHLSAACTNFYGLPCGTWPTAGEFCAAWLPGGFQGLFGPGCSMGFSQAIAAGDAANAQVAAENVETLNANVLNVTNSGVASINATFQELLSYYENRAEAIIPFFLNNSWNNLTEAAVLTDSGLLSSLEGIITAFAKQQYQDWNATAGSWNAAFAAGGQFSNQEVLEEIYHNNPAITSPIAYSSFFTNDTPINVSRPFEDWSTAPVNGVSVNNSYFNMQSGGTIISANEFNSSLFSTPGYYAGFTVTDLTQNFSFAVPTVSYTAWLHGVIPDVSAIHHINQFDVLQLRCTSFCSAGDGGQPVNPTYQTLQTSNAYVVTSKPKTPIGTINTMYPYLIVSNTATSIAQLAQFRMLVPQPGWSTCVINDGTTPAYTGACTTWASPTGGNSTELSTGPGQAIGGNATLMSFPITAQALVTNTLTMAHDYWTTLRSITLNGTYAIPANCAIPTPSDAFPTATNFLNYNLSANNVEIVYLAYLDAVAREYGDVFTNSIGFCGDPHLGFSFNWTSSWDVALNISASVYLAGPLNGTTVPLRFDGTAAKGTNYTDVSTWPAYNVQPALLYPYEYQMNVPVGKIWPVPVNDPVIAVLVNYPGNLYYNTTAFTPHWGVPTYAGLTGNGNYTEVSGNSSTITSGKPVASADAIEINSCYLNGVAQNPCDISATYFDNFTIGIVHAILPPVFISPGNPGGSGVNGGICNSLFGWIPFIGAPIVTLCNLILGVLEIVFIIILLIVAIWVVFRYSTRSKGGGGGGTTINVS